MGQQKMMVLRVTVVAALSVAALAQPVAARQHADGGKKPAKICREDRSTGSIMSTRVCHSEEEWAQIGGRNGDAARDTMERVGQPTNQARR